MLSQTIPE